MKRRTLAIAGSVAALSLVGAPIAAAASAPHSGAKAKVESRTDRSVDVRGSSHADKSLDKTSKTDRSSTDSKLDR